MTILESPWEMHSKEYKHAWYLAPGIGSLIRKIAVKMSHISQKQRDFCPVNQK